MSIWIRRTEAESIRFDRADERDTLRVLSEPWPFDWTPPGPDPETNRRYKQARQAEILARLGENVRVLGDGQPW